MKWGKTVVGAVLALLLLVAAERHLGSARMAAKVSELEADKVRLEGFIERLSASRRVAQVRVVRQSADESGAPVSTLEWQEFTAEGLVMPPVQVRVIGRLAYFEAWVIKFDHVHVAEGDADRGRSVALFRRVFGDQEAPESVAMLHTLSPADSAEPTASAERALWDRFWDFVDEPDRAAKLGIRVAQCEAPAVPVSVGDTFEVVLDAAGGLNVRKTSIGVDAVRISPP
jgi:hypothetical protein